MKILIIGPTRIGDTVLSSGIVDHISKSYPQAQITVACGAISAPLYKSLPNLDQIIPITKKTASTHWWGVWLEVYRTRWDLVIDFRRSIVPWVIRAKSRIVTKAALDINEHRVVSYSRALGLENSPPSPVLWTSVEDENRANTLIPDGGPVVAVAPTANWRGKMWDLNRFVSVINRITNVSCEKSIFPDARIAILGGPGEETSASILLESIAQDRLLNLVGKEDLYTISACLRRCSLFIGNDSGLMHMAAAANIPTLGLFGPSRVENYHPWGKYTEAVCTEKSYHELVKKPVKRADNSYNMMDSLTVDSVVEAVENLLFKHKIITI